MNNIKLNIKSITTFSFFLALFMAAGMFFYSCVDEPMKEDDVVSEEQITEADVSAFIQTIEKENETPTSTGEFSNAHLSKAQKEIIYASQLRYGDCSPEITDGTQVNGRMIHVSAPYFQVDVTYDYNYLPNNGGISITHMSLDNIGGYWGNKILPFFNVNNSLIQPNLKPNFNWFRGFFYAFIASRIEEDVVTQPNVVDYSSNWIFFGIFNKLDHNCWTATGSCSGNPFNTCCQRTAYFYSETGTPSDFDRYYIDGYAFIQGGSSLQVCYGSGSSCGGAGVQCDNSSTGFNSHQ